MNAPLALRFEPMMDCPDPWAAALSGLSTDEERQAYEALHGRVQLKEDADRWSPAMAGKLLGWPQLVQGEDSLALQLDSPPDACRLLLQVNDYHNGVDGVTWGPGGSLYYFLAERHFAKAKWHRAELAGLFT